MSTVLDKSGCSVQAVAAQVKEDVRNNGKRPVLVVPLAAEDAAFANALFHFAADEIAAGAKLAAEAAGGADIIFYDTDEARANTLVIAAGGNASGLCGAGGPVLREESALFAAMAGELVRCELEARAFPTEGWQGRPTQVLDAETAYWLSKEASGEAQGKLVLNTAAAQPGPQAFALGTPLSEVAAALGVAAEKPVLLGGVTGRFAGAEALAAETLAYTRDFDTLHAYTNETCMADAGRALTAQITAASCGKCVLCREGSWQFSAMFEDICAGRGKKTDFALIPDIGGLIAAGAFCSFGRDMARVPMTLAALCGPELEAHVTRKACPAGVCAAFKSYAIDPALCDGCGDCLDECPGDAIEGKPGFIHMIDASMCEKCGMCAGVCPQKAIVAGGKFRVPKKLTRAGKF